MWMEEKLLLLLFLHAPDERIHTQRDITTNRCILSLWNMSSCPNFFCICQPRLQAPRAKVAALYVRPLWLYWALQCGSPSCSGCGARLCAESRQHIPRTELPGNLFTDHVDRSVPRLLSRRRKEIAYYDSLGCVEEAQRYVRSGFASFEGFLLPKRALLLLHIRSSARDLRPFSLEGRRPATRTSLLVGVPGYQSVEGDPRTVC